VTPRFLQDSLRPRREEPHALRCAANRTGHPQRAHSTRAGYRPRRRICHL